jgi:hemoglobin-like flavoprotein
MDAIQKDHIRRSFASVAAIAPAAAALFYRRLFTLDPQLRALFPGEPDSPAMANQGAKLMQTLSVAVAQLDSLDQLTPALEALARRHATYGVLPAQYDTVGAALLWTLEQGLGAAFTPDVAAAWAELYQTLAATMKRAAYGEESCLDVASALPSHTIR